MNEKLSRVFTMKKLLCILIICFIFFASANAEETTNAEIEKSLTRLDQVIAKNPKDAKNYVARGDIFHSLDAIVTLFIPAWHRLTSRRYRVHRIVNFL